MGRYVTSDDPEIMREELNQILKKLWQDVDEVAGRAGDFTLESRRIAKGDYLFDDPTKGPVLKSDSNPNTYWRMWVDSSGTVSTEEVTPNLKE